MGDSVAQKVWDTALGQLQLHVTRSNYDTWLKDTVGLEMSGRQLVVGTPTEFVREWLTSRMRSLVSQTVADIAGGPVDVEFQITGRNGTNPSGDGLPLAKAARQSTPPTRVNPRYSFRSFVVGDCNRLAASAALTAAERPAEEYNPLFIYSAPGLGKTHLLHAIAQEATASHRSALFVTAEQFTNDFVTAIAHSRSAEFRQRYRSVQFLLIDDIQFLASKERTQEEFFYTFNDLHFNGCQLVVACDRPPAAVSGLQERLCSRFQWGLVADIQPPDLPTRLAILTSLARQQGTPLSQDVMELLADRCRSNIRELQGSLNRVVAFGRLTKAQTISVHLAERALSALQPDTSPCADPQVILDAVSRYYSIPHKSLTGKTRTRPIAEARHVAMYLLREDAQLPLKQVGLLLGHRDHSTIIHGVQKVSRQLTQDPRTASQLADVRAMASH
jgi:chromosomal replication initiator protein